MVLDSVNIDIGIWTVYFIWTTQLAIQDMVTLRPIDLISKVCRTHQLVYRCGKKTKQQNANVCTIRYKILTVNAVVVPFHPILCVPFIDTARIIVNCLLKFSAIGT